MVVCGPDGADSVSGHERQTRCIRVCEARPAQGVKEPARLGMIFGVRFQDVQLGKAVSEPPEQARGLLAVAVKEPGMGFRPDKNRRVPTGPAAGK